MEKRIFAKYPKCSKKVFEEMNKDMRYRCVMGIIGDIGRSKETILREEQRIKKAKKCINLAISSIKGKISRDVSKKYYKDMLDSKISESRSKIKN